MFLANLMELSFGEFDLTLGMGWLVEHRVSLDCTFKRVTLRFDCDTRIVIIGEHRDYLSNVISTLVIEKLVRKGCEAYLTYVCDFGSTKHSIKDIQTVRDVFPKELSRIPPDREVEFGIKLLLGTTLVSIAPYCMTPKELMDLNT